MSGRKKRESHMPAQDFDGIRERLGLSYEELGDRLEIGRTTAWRYAHDAAPIPVDVALRVRTLEKELHSGNGQEVPLDPGAAIRNDGRAEAGISGGQAQAPAVAQVSTLQDGCANPHAAPAVPPLSPAVSAPAGMAPPVPRFRGYMEWHIYAAAALVILSLGTIVLGATLFLGKMIQSGAMASRSGGSTESCAPAVARNEGKSADPQDPATAWSPVGDYYTGIEEVLGQLGGVIVAAGKAPPTPFKWQKQAPCGGEEVELNKACWWKLEVRNACPSTAFEYNSMCLVPAVPDQKPPKPVSNPK